MVCRGTVAAIAGLFLGSLLSVPTFAQVPGDWIMEGGTRDGGSREVTLYPKKGGGWKVYFKEGHPCEHAPRYIINKILDADSKGKGKMQRCPSARWVKLCFNLDVKKYAVDFTATLVDEHTITGKYTTKGGIERERPIGTSPIGCDLDPKYDFTGDFTLRCKDCCPTAAQQRVARKILEKIYGKSIVVPPEELSPEVVFFAFDKLRELDEASRLSTALSKFLKPLPYTSLSDLGDVMVEGIEVLLDDPESFKSNRTMLPAMTQYEKTLRQHFGSIPKPGGRCGERENDFSYP